MNIDYTVTALMFPAIPLLMSVYSNRFHSLSMLIRELHDEHVYENHIPHEWKKQFINLKWTDHTTTLDNHVCCFWIFVQYVNCIRSLFK